MIEHPDVSPGKHADQCHAFASGKAPPTFFLSHVCAFSEAT